MNPDVVYVVRPGDRNEELRYSLRSLANLPHGRVWIAGYKPRWVSDEVGHIPAPQQGSGHANAKANLRAACEHPEVSESFAYFNDDFFVMQPMDELPVMHRGPVVEVVQSGIMATAYSRWLRRTMTILQQQGISDPLCYDLHAPMLVDKVGLLRALDLCESPLIQERTLYGNLQHVGGERRQNHKIRRAMQKGWESWPFLSTNDHTFRTLPVGQYIRDLFADPTPYETETPLAPMGDTPNRNPHPLRRPVRYHSVGSRVRAVA